MQQAPVGGAHVLESQKVPSPWYSPGQSASRVTWQISGPVQHAPQKQSAAQLLQSSQRVSQKPSPQAEQSSGQEQLSSQRKSQKASPHARQSSGQEPQSSSAPQVPSPQNEQ
jgi:hypothetical protein